MKKNDFYIIAAVLIIAAAIFIALQLNNGFNKTGAYFVKVDIKGNDAVYYSLEEDIIVRIDTDEGYNLLKIDNNTATIIEADCNNQICVKSNAINKPGQSIVCMPHNMAITIVVK